MIIVPPCGLSLSCDLKLQHVSFFLTAECSNNFHISALSLLSNPRSWRHMVSVIPGFIWHLLDLEWNLFNLFHSVLSDSRPYISLNWALGFFRWATRIVKASHAFHVLVRKGEKDLMLHGGEKITFWSHSGIRSLLVEPDFTAVAEPEIFFFLLWAGLDHYWLKGGNW